MSEFRLAQISDLHIHRAQASAAKRFDRWLSDCIARVNSESPDLVLCTGDLAQTGCAEEYRRLSVLLRSLNARYYLMPGNHDDVPALRKVFGDEEYLFQNDGHVSYELDAGPLRILALDSTKPRRAGGFLDGARLDWLNARLQAHNDKPIILALHHPPFTAGVWPLDWLGFVKVRQLESIVREHARIKRILSGHVHCARASSWGGTFACTSPSTRPQRLVLGVGGRLPVIHFERAGFLMHSLELGELHTHVHRIDGMAEPLEIGI
jgi:3',5'-cyclic AMP phosphodiesterase CpdA